MTLNLTTLLLVTTTDAIGRSLTAGPGAAAAAAAAAVDSDDGWDGNCRLNIRRNLRRFARRLRGAATDECQGCLQGAAKMICDETNVFELFPLTRQSSGDASAAATLPSSGSGSFAAPAAPPRPSNFGWYGVDYEWPLPDQAEPCKHCEAHGANAATAEEEQEQEELCSICYDDEEEDCLVKLCDRGHKLHAKCAIKYLGKMQKEVCPLCNVPETNFLSHCERKLTVDMTKGVEGGDKVAKFLLNHKAEELQRAANIIPTVDDTVRLREMEYRHATEQELAIARQDNTIAQLDRNLARRKQRVAAREVTPMPPRREWRTLPGRMRQTYNNDRYFRRFKGFLDGLGREDVVLMAISANVPLDLAPLDVIKEEYAKLAQQHHLDERYNALARGATNAQQLPAEAGGPGFEYELVEYEGNVVLPYVTVERKNTGSRARLTTNAEGRTGLAWGRDALDDQDPIFTFCVLKKDPRTQAFKVAFNSYDYQHPQQYPFPGGLPHQPFPVFAGWATGSVVTREYNEYKRRGGVFALPLTNGNRMDAQWYINVRASQVVAERRALEEAAQAGSIAAPPSMAPVGAAEEEE